MAIVVSKTLQGVEYMLYFTTEVKQTEGDTIRLVLTGYQSEGHFNDDFLPIIQKSPVVKNKNRAESVIALYEKNYKEAVELIESFLVGNVPYFVGGVVKGDEG